LDRFTRNYLVGVCVVAALGLLYFLTSGDPRVDELNAQLSADPQLAAYPYSFRVLELDSGVAVMGSPRWAGGTMLRRRTREYSLRSRGRVDARCGSTHRFASRRATTSCTGSSDALQAPASRGVFAE
jgi:hypothetical protein